MRSEFAALVSRLDVVLWFLRVQLWLSLATLLTGFPSPYGYGLGLNQQYLLVWVLPILILLVFPRALASAMLGQSAREELSLLPGLSSLVGGCVGLGAASVSFCSSAHWAMLYVFPWFWAMSSSCVAV